MKLRWKLSTLFVVMLIAAIFLGRYSYIQNRFAELRECGAVIAYDWERPTVSRNQYVTYFSGKKIRHVRHTLNCAPRQKTWFEHLNGWIAGDSVIAITVDAEAWDASAIESMRSMDKLEFVLITKAAVFPEPNASLASLISTLEKEFPDVSIHTDPEMKFMP